MKRSECRLRGWARPRGTVGHTVISRCLMRKQLLLLALVALPGIAIPVALPAQSDILVSTEWLAERLDDPEVVVLHVGNAQTYTQGHIPGARLMDPAIF